MLSVIFAAATFHASGYFLPAQQLLSMKTQAAVKSLERQGFRVLKKPESPAKPSLDSIDTMVKWAFTSSFDVRLAAPRSWPRLEYVEISYCPADDRIAGIAVAYHRNEATLQAYASLTREATESLGTSPAEISNNSGVLSTVWKSQDGQDASAWYRRDAGMGLAFSGSVEAIQCNLQFGTQDIKESRP